MTTNEYSEFHEATEALKAASAEGLVATVKTYQRSSDLAWVWVVTTSPAPTVE